jgi:hypothetical protein
VSVIATVTLTHVVYLVRLEPKTKGGGETLPHFLGIIALATVPADAYEDSRAYLS